MIIQPARIVVIDNDEKHLKALTDTLCGLGTACLPFHYREDHPTANLLKGARFIFCDLHLISDAVTTDKKTQYSNIASMLLAGLDEQHGPYVLIIWSEFPDEIHDLEKYLEELNPGQKPIKCCVLNKNDYISTASKPGEKDEDLASAVIRLFDDVPGLSALLKWEQDVSAAAAETTSILWDLCQGENEARRDTSLRNTLGKLAKGASGASTAKEFPGRGVIEALSPLLSDRLEKGQIDEESWKTSVAFDEPATAVSGASLYSMLYFEIPSAHSSTERGAICELPEEWSEDEQFLKRTGFSKGQLVGECGYKGEKLKSALDNSKWYLIQMNAACDQAQNHPGLIPYVLGFTIPAAKSNDNRRGSVWCSRNLKVDEEERQLFCHGRFVFGLSQGETEKLSVKMRVRTQLLDQMVQEIRMNSARLGTIEPH